MWVGEGRVWRGARVGEGCGLMKGECGAGVWVADMCVTLRCKEMGVWDKRGAILAILSLNDGMIRNTLLRDRM